jgi:tetratricopeptide (TPR) repeat protein
MPRGAAPENGIAQGGIFGCRLFFMRAWHPVTDILLDKYREQFREALARVYIKEGDFDRAAAEYVRLIKRDPQNTISLIHPRFYYSLGKIYEQKRMKDKARRHYRRFLDLWKDADPGQPEIEDAKARMAAL